MVAGIECHVWGLAKYLAYFNMAIGCLPSGATLSARWRAQFRAFVWAVTRNMRRATLIAANVGTASLVLSSSSSWFCADSRAIWAAYSMAFIGCVFGQCRDRQVRQVMFQGLLAGHTVSQAMSTRCVTIPADLTLQRLVDEYILSGGQRCFPRQSRRKHRRPDDSAPDQRSAAARVGDDKRCSSYAPAREIQAH